MHSRTLASTPTRIIRVLLAAVLLAALTLVASPAPVQAAVSFTDLGSLGLPAVRYGSLAWGDYDSDGDLDVLIAGCADASCTARVARVYRNDGGSFADANAGLPGVAYGAAAWGDYDGDADLDFLLAGHTGAERIARIYRNDSGSFTDVAAGLQGVTYAAAAWGDYDNDGDLDLLLGGYADSGRLTALYRNDAGTFVDAGAQLPGTSDGSVAWGDYDNDGDPDLLLAGYATVAIARIYRNDGQGAFADIGAGLPGVYYASAAWGDYDNDGDLDVLLAGYTGSAALARAYRNNGNGTFSDVAAGLPAADHGAAAWGDYDNDGDLDILLSGASGTKRIADVYRNNGDGTFGDARARLTGVQDSAVAWGDYDNDADLDLLVAGYTGSACATKVYRTGGGAANTVPAAPAGLAATVNGLSVALSWNAASDPQTPAAGLTYNLRVGTAPGGVNVMPPMANTTTGWRRLPQLGNVQHGTTARLSLPFGAYYWSVQAVDTAFAGGAFAQEGSFTIAPAPPGPVALAGPSAGKAATTHVFTATVEPETAGMPLTYLWEASGQTPVVHEVSSRTDTVGFSWAAGGPKVVTATVSNTLGTAWATHAITIEAFSELTLGLEQVIRASVAWGDYDNDGDLDLLLAGQNPSGSPVTRLYRNDAGAFADAGAGLLGIKDGAVAWGDYDRDGYLDIVLTGDTSPSSTFAPAARLYHNNGNGTFSSVSAGFQALALPGIDWGDYDDDGDLDLLWSGGYNSDYAAVTRLYRNNGSTFGEVLGTGLAAVSYSAAAWGDYDHDGDLDLLLAGWTGSQTIARIYRSDGNGHFTDIGAGLQGVLWASAAWGDYDNDGDLDVALLGKTAPAGVRTGRIYRNDGSGQFVDLGAALAPASAGSMAWGDYDNDGDLDLLETCAEGTHIYRNDGADTFTDSGVGLAGVSYASAAWGDYDDDGDLDVLLAGALGGDPAQRFTRVYRNNAGQANTPPAAPTGLGATAQGGAIALSWSAASDPQTPAAGLTYNLRVGTAPGGQDVLPAMADPGSGWRRLPRLGSANHGLTATLSLAPGTYYWSVQAVDAALAGGAFAGEQSFVMPCAPAQVAIAGPTEGALHVAQAFTATVSPADAGLPITYTWQATGQSAVVHGGVSRLTDTVAFTWTLPGPQTVTVTAANSLGTASGTHSLTVHAPPVAGFTGAPTAGPAPLTVVFTNTTTGLYTSSEWDFGDAITSTLPSPTHTYTIPGVYTVTLTATGPGGSDAEVKPAYVTAHTPVQAGFDAAPTSGVRPLAVVFTNTTTGDWTSSAWDFGDGITSTLESPTHTYGVKGVYTITLTVEGPGGRDEEVKPALIAVYDPALAGFTLAPAGGLAPLLVAFTNASTGDFETSLWDFGDGITSTLPGPTHTYTAAGLYTVTLTVEGLGGVDTEQKANAVAVYETLPEPGLHRTDLCLQNLGPSDAAANLVYFQAGGLTRRSDLGRRIPHLGWHRVNAEEMAPGAEGAWAGPGRILATQPLAAVVEMQWDHASATYARPVAATAAYVPHLTAGDGRLTLLTVQNAESTAASVTLRFYDRRGQEKRVHQADLPPRGAATFSVATLFPDLTATGGYGAAWITATGRIAVVASVHEGEGSEACAGVTAGETALWFPGMARRENAGAWDHGEADVHNTAALTATVHVQFRNPDGSLAHELDDAIPPHGAAAYSTRDRGTLEPAAWQALVNALGDQWTGSVHVASTNGRPLVGVALGWRAALTDSLAYQAAPASAPGQALAFPAVYRKLTGGAGEQWSRAYVQNASSTASTLTVEFYDAQGVRVGEAYAVAIPAHGAACLDLKEGADLPPAALAALGSDFSGALVVTPSAGLEIVGASQTFWPGEGRAAGYAGLPVP